MTEPTRSTTEVAARLTAALAERYRIERELGQGGMATVYLAHDIKHERDVAIKVLHPDLGAALGGERFLSEIRTTARLQHPHILPLLDSGEADGLLYYVMPLVTGETLRARLERERQLPIDDAVRIAREVADALGYAHGLGVIHRDIKPENILLQGGHALVADFGIALAVQTAGGARMTQTGLSLGTPQYMSPEQAMGEKQIDARSDIYALGAVTYEMLVGEAPFTGPSVQAIVARLITESPRELAGQRKAVPAHVEDAVLRALEKLPADRFATAAELSAALGGRLTATSTRSHRRAGTTVPTGRPRFRAGIVVVGLAILGVGAVAGWIMAPRAATQARTADAVSITSILPPVGGNFGEQRALALTPDGRRLAFVFSALDGSRMLWLRYIDRLEAVPIEGTAGANAPFWSPDGRSLGFFANGYLTVLDDNGDLRRLCPVSAATGGSWNVDGVILFGHGGGLSTVPTTGGACRVVVPPGGGPPPRGVFLPDGKRFAYARGPRINIKVADLEGRQLAEWEMSGYEIAITGPGFVLVPNTTDSRAVDAQRFNTRTLALEGPVVRVASDVRSQGGVHTFSVSSTGAFAFLPGRADRPYLEYDASGQLRDTVRVDGTWTLSVRPRRAGTPVVAVGGNVVGLWLYDLDADRGTRLLMRDTSTAPGIGVGTTYPVWSEDGSRLIYALIRPKQCRIIERTLATDAERVVLDEATTDVYQCAVPLDWSDDGLSVLVRRDTTLGVIGIDGAMPERRIVRPGRLWEGQFSPDGRTVAYSSDETGRSEAYVQSFPDGSPTRVSREGARWPTWTHGGRRLTFVTPDGRVQEVTMGTDQRTPVGAVRNVFAAPSWRRSTFDDRGVGFAVVGDGERYLIRQSTSGIAVAYMTGWPNLLTRTSVKP